MTTDWPHASVSFWPMARARMSVLPPGGKGTISRTGLEGNVAGASAASAGERRGAGERGGEDECGDSRERRRAHAFE